MNNAEQEREFFDLRQRLRASLHGTHRPPMTLSEVLADYALQPDDWHQYLMRGNLDDVQKDQRIHVMLAERPEMAALAASKSAASQSNHGARSEKELIDPTLSVVADLTASAKQPRLTEPGAFSELVRSGKYQELGRQLLPWLPHLLRHVGVDRSETETCLQFILEQLPEMPSEQPFRDALLRLLADFSRLQSTSVSSEPSVLELRDLDDLLRQIAVQQSLEESAEHDSDSARRFRQRVLQQHVESPEEILNVEPGESEDKEVANALVYRQDLYQKCQAKLEYVRRLFE